MSYFKFKVRFQDNYRPVLKTNFIHFLKVWLESLSSILAFGPVTVKQTFDSYYEQANLIFLNIKIRIRKRKNKILLTFAMLQKLQYILLYTVTQHNHLFCLKNKKQLLLNDYTNIRFSLALEEVLWVR